LGLALAHLIGAREPAKIARAVPVLGYKEAGGFLPLSLREYGRRCQSSHRERGKRNCSPHW
jgi:hypothetical protein